MATQTSPVELAEDSDPSSCAEECGCDPELICSPSGTIIEEPPKLEAMKSVDEVLDGYINAEESTSIRQPFTLALPAGIKGAYTGWVGADVTCDADLEYDYWDMPRIIMMPSDGEWQVCALLTPSTGESIYASSPTIIRDTVPPEVVETQVVKEGNPYILDVSVNEKDTIEAWTKVSGDGVLTFAPLDGGGVSVTSDQIGNYVAKLTLTDKAGNRSEVQVDIPISAE